MGFLLSSCGWWIAFTFFSRLKAHAEHFKYHISYFQPFLCFLRKLCIIGNLSFWVKHIEQLVCTAGFILGCKDLAFIRVLLPEAVSVHLPCDCDITIMTKYTEYEGFFISHHFYFYYYYVSFLLFIYCIIYYYYLLLLFIVIILVIINYIIY